MTKTNNKRGYGAASVKERKLKRRRIMFSRKRKESSMKEDKSEDRMIRSKVSHHGTDESDYENTNERPIGKQMNFSKEQKNIDYNSHDDYNDGTHQSHRCTNTKSVLEEIKSNKQSQDSEESPLHQQQKKHSKNRFVFDDSQSTTSEECWNDEIDGNSHKCENLTKSNKATHDSLKFELELPHDKIENTTPSPSYNDSIIKTTSDSRCDNDEDDSSYGSKHFTPKPEVERATTRKAKMRRHNLQKDADRSNKINNEMFLEEEDKDHRLLSGVEQLFETFQVTCTNTMQKRMNSNASKNGLTKLTNVSRMIKETIMNWIQHDKSTNSSIGTMMVGLFQMSLRLFAKYNDKFVEGFALNGFILQHHFMIKSIKDLYDIYIENNKTEWMIELIDMFGDDEISIKNLIHMIGGVVISSDKIDDVSNYNPSFESILTSFLYCLHSIPIHSLSSIILRSCYEDGCSVWSSLAKVASNVSKFPSYATMEACIAFFHKLRCTLLWSLAKDSFDGQHKENSEQERVIFTIIRLQNLFHAAFVDDIDRVGPIVNSEIHRQLFPGNQPRTQLLFSQWIRKAILTLQKIHSCEYVSSFPCNGVYAPREDGIGTQIAIAPFIDINQSSLSLFYNESQTLVSDIDNCRTNFGFHFASRRIATIEFSDYENGKLFGLLNHRDCALTVLLTETQWNDSGLENMHATTFKSGASTSNSTDSSRAIKLFIKRSEYENFVVMLNSRGLLVQNESDLDEDSSSASIRSKFSTRVNKVRDHVEFSTRIDDKEKFLALKNQLQSLYQESSQSDYAVPHYQQTSNSHEEDDLETVYKGQDNSEQIENETAMFDADTRPSSQMIGSQPNQSYQSPPRLSAIEVTPTTAVKVKNDNCESHDSHVDLGVMDRPLERFSAICCCYGVRGGVATTMNDPMIDEITNNVILFEETLSNAHNAIRDLQIVTNKLGSLLAAAPKVQPKVVNSFDCVGRCHQDINEVSKSWFSNRQSIEREIVKRMHSTG